MFEKFTAPKQVYLKNGLVGVSVNQVPGLRVMIFFRSGKTRKHVENMFPETFAAFTCFTDVSQFCHVEDSVSGSKICFCRQAETHFVAGNNVPRVAKL